MTVGVTTEVAVDIIRNLSSLTRMYQLEMDGMAKNYFDELIFSALILNRLINKPF